MFPLYFLCENSSPFLFFYRVEIGYHVLPSTKKPGESVLVQFSQHPWEESNDVGSQTVFKTVPCYMVHASTMECCLPHLHYVYYRSIEKFAHHRYVILLEPSTRLSFEGDRTNTLITTVPKLYPKLLIRRQSPHSIRRAIRLHQK